MGNGVFARLSFNKQLQSCPNGELPRIESPLLVRVSFGELKLSNSVGLERAASPTAFCTSPVFGKVCIPLKWFLSYALCNFLRSYRSSRTASRSAWLRPPHRSLLCVHRRKRIENASPVHLFCSIRSLRSALPLAVAIALCGRLQVSLWLCYGSPRMLGTPSGQQARRA